MHSNRDQLAGSAFHAVRERLYEQSKHTSCGLGNERDTAVRDNLSQLKIILATKGRILRVHKGHRERGQYNGCVVGMSRQRGDGSLTRWRFADKACSVRGFRGLEECHRAPAAGCDKLLFGALSLLRMTPSSWSLVALFPRA